MIKAITKNDGEKAESTDKGSVVANRMAMFQQSAKKQSLIVTSTSSNSKNIHNSQINSCVVAKEGLITSDYTGFVKIWKY